MSLYICLLPLFEPWILMKKEAQNDPSMYIPKWEGSQDLNKVILLRYSTRSPYSVVIS